MPKNPEHFIGCPSGKRGYEDYQTANKFRRFTVSTNIKNGRIGQDNRVLNVYECKRCDQWHVGHKIMEEEIQK